MTDTPREERLLEALDQASEANVFTRDCQLCQALEEMSEPARNKVETILEGRLVGTRKLAAILTDSGYPVGRRAIDKHREGHAS